MNGVEPSGPRALRSFGSSATNFMNDRRSPARNASTIATALGFTNHLGSGGMGDVYQATDSKLGRSVAIKFLPEAFSHDSDRVARFEREARALVSLNQSNIAAIYGFEQSATQT